MKYSHQNLTRVDHGMTDYPLFPTVPGKLMLLLMVRAVPSWVMQQHLVWLGAFHHPAGLVKGIFHLAAGSVRACRGEEHRRG